MTGRVPAVLFVCVRNAGKSQMATGLLRRRAGSTIDVTSAGTKAGTTLNAQSVEALAQVGVDISDQQPQQLTAEMVLAADVVIVLGTQAQLDRQSGPRYETWDVDEPSGRGVDGIERMRLVRDDIARQVDALLTRL